ncbi:hypothetical protein SKAU_G00033820 [Synaphobranchus kaupii]|uniref:Uncharacterized protein n=1 Tax=Synaphobranchus kaupii TaxID=118154 RepID=A0A9Q1JGI9_SYNKA|nr:hypothetical protein SKAU_G00033820 [Synaphobranchus kaupii]
MSVIRADMLAAKRRSARVPGPTDPGAPTLLLRKRAPEPAGTLKGWASPTHRGRDDALSGRAAGRPYFSAALTAAGV